MPLVRVADTTDPIKMARLNVKELCKGLDLNVKFPYNRSSFGCGFAIRRFRDILKLSARSYEQGKRLLAVGVLCTWLALNFKIICWHVRAKVPIENWRARVFHRVHICTACRVVKSWFVVRLCGAIVGCLHVDN